MFRKSGSVRMLEMSRHVLWLENSMSLSVAAVCRMKELARGRQGVGRGAYGRAPLVPY